MKLIDRWGKDEITVNASKTKKLIKHTDTVKSKSKAGGK